MFLLSLFLAFVGVGIGAVIEAKFKLVSLGENDAIKLYKELIDFSKGLHDRVLALENKVKRDV